MTTPPTGTVTFLLTDLEGSTRLWEEHPAEMKSALAHHDEILRTAIEDAGGYVFSTAGDSFAAAFQAVQDAFRSAVGSQRALAAKDWGHTGIRVRMAVHTGEADERGGDYFGPVVNRTARLMAAGHGGQVLVSSTTSEIVAAGLPDEVSLRDLGEHRLRDLSRPQRVYQLVHPDLQSEFAALRTLETFSHNLPIQLTSFVGREQELAEVSKLLAGSRMVTLTGVGGTGKTRLAIQLGAEVLDEFSDGVWLAELAPVTSPDLIVAQVATAVGLAEQTERPIEEALRQFLGRQELLLIVDNCEHLLDPTSDLIQSLLQSASGLKVIATSREILGVPGEVPFRVRSMPVPGSEVPAEAMTRYEAVRLFVARAETAAPTFRLSSDNAGAVVKICARLDGMPLALELAAARLRGLSPAQLADRLDDQFRLLTGGARTALPRQQTLRATMDWSHDLLEEHEQVVLRRLSVFRGGFTLEAAEEICGTEPLDSQDILELLLSLVDRSLVSPTDHAGELRYRLLEPVRQYAWEKLMEAGEGDTSRYRHAEWYVDLARQGDLRLFESDGVEWAERLETEFDNIRAALTWSLESGSPEIALRIVSHLAFFFVIHHIGEGREWATRALEASPEEDSVDRAGALLALGQAASLQDDQTAASDALQRSAEMARSVGDRAMEGRASGHLGATERVSGDTEPARRHLSAGISLLEGTQFESRIPMFLNQLSALARYEGDLDEAREFAQEAARIAEQHSHTPTISAASAFLGWVELRAGNWDDAERLLRKRLASPLTDAVTAQIHAALTWAAVGQGDLGKAASHASQAIEIAQHAGSRLSLQTALESCAQLTAASGRGREAVRLYASLTAYLEEAGRWFPPDSAADHRRKLDELRESLGEDVFEQEWSSGVTTTLDDAAEMAMTTATEVQRLD